MTTIAPSKKLTVADLVKFLSGNSQSIERVAATPAALWIGAAFVLSAGFAREYDGESLLHEPWHLLIPCAASLLTSALLYGMAFYYGRGEGPYETLSFRSFLTLYWFTAPLAWVYAVPVERMMDLGDATRANLSLLAIVAVWRVALMVRVITVTRRLSWWMALFTVMVFADVVALLLIWFMPMPVISFMGGIRLNEREELLVMTRFSVVFFGVVTLPIWLIGYGIAIFKAEKRVAMWRQKHPPIAGTDGEESKPKQDIKALDSQSAEDRRIGRSLGCLAAVSLVIWAPILPYTQPEQQRRRFVERAFLSGDMSRLDNAALQRMREWGPGMFPPHWEPPPWLSFNQREPPLIDLIEAVERETKDSPQRLVGDSWLEGMVWDKWLASVNSGFEFHQHWRTLETAEIERWIALWEALPADSPVLEEQLYNISKVVKHADRYPNATENHRERIIAILKRAGMMEEDYTPPTEALPPGD